MQAVQLDPVVGRRGRTGLAHGGLPVVLGGVRVALLALAEEPADLLLALEVRGQERVEQEAVRVVPRVVGAVVAVDPGVVVQLPGAQDLGRRRVGDGAVAVRDLHDHPLVAEHRVRPQAGGVGLRAAGALDPGGAGQRLLDRDGTLEGVADLRVTAQRHRLGVAEQTGAAVEQAGRREGARLQGPEAAEPADLGDRATGHVRDAGPDLGVGAEQHGAVDPAEALAEVGDDAVADTGVDRAVAVDVDALLEGADEGHVVHDGLDERVAAVDAAVRAERGDALDAADDAVAVDVTAAGQQVTRAGAGRRPHLVGRLRAEAVAGDVGGEDRQVAQAEGVGGAEQVELGVAEAVAEDHR